MIARLLERLLIRLRILATPEEDAYLDWAERRQDLRDARERAGLDPETGRPKWDTGV